ncbi:MAG: 2-oxoglutarate oxidoreductase [Thermodesulfobacteriota bacterium]
MNQPSIRPSCLKPGPLPYCTGCGHAIVHGLLARILAELELDRRSILVPSSGCAQAACEHLDLDMGQAPRGQALAVATGLKRVLPQQVVLAYQGEGELIAGLDQALLAAQAGEGLTLLLVNNQGPDAAWSAPLDLGRLLAGAAGCAFAERVALTDPEQAARAGQALAQALRVQMQGAGFSLVEVLAPCPERWHMSPAEALAWSGGPMARALPLGPLSEARP